MSLAPLAWLPSGALTILKEVARHLLRRPVVGICAVASTSDGRVLLIRRADTGTWALPGGTLEWGEQLRDALPRELEEEAGAHVLAIGEVRGVYSRPDRDPRFHAVTVCVKAQVGDALAGPKNRLEVREAQFFRVDELPGELAMGMREMLDHALGEDLRVMLE
ncbi:MAG: NUDIX hydrolase [Deltaproteobacteria bacterium]|nr:NUDIX hydrolase [Deltaproteobacteria bacterium]